MNTAANEGVFRCLRNFAKASVGTEPVQPIDPKRDYYWASGTHPDVLERLWDQLGKKLPVDSGAVIPNWLADLRFPWHDCGMAPETLNALLKLPPRDRAELAMALWESLDYSQREKELALTAEQLTEIERRLAVHLADAGSAIPWKKMRRKLTRRQ